MISKNVQKVLALVTMNNKAYEKFSKDVAFSNLYELNDVDVDALNFVKSNYAHSLQVMADILSKRRCQNTQKYLPLFYKIIQEKKWLNLWEDYLSSQIHLGMVSSREETLKFSEFAKTQPVVQDLEKEILIFESKKLEVLNFAMEHVSNINIQEQVQSSYPFVNPAYQLVDFNYDILNIINNIQKNIFRSYDCSKTKLLICSTWDGLNTIVLEADTNLLEVMKVCTGKNNIDSLYSLLKNVLVDQIDLVKDILKPLHTARLLIYCSGKV